MDNIFCAIMHADESVHELDQADVQTVLQAFRSHPWTERTAKPDESEYADELHICSGPNAENGDMVIVGYDNGTFLVMLNVYKSERILGIIPRKKNIYLAIENANANEVEDCLRKFIEYPLSQMCEWIEMKRKSTANR